MTGGPKVQPGHETKAVIESSIKLGTDLFAQHLLSKIKLNHKHLLVLIDLINNLNERTTPSITVTPSKSRLPKFDIK